MERVSNRTSHTFIPIIITCPTNTCCHTRLVHPRATLIHTLHTSPILCLTHLVTLVACLAYLISTCPITFKTSFPYECLLTIQNRWTTILCDFITNSRLLDWFYEGTIDTVVIEVSEQCMNNVIMNMMMDGMWMRQRMKSVVWWVRMNEGGGMWCCYCSNRECELIDNDWWIMWWGRWEFFEVCDVIKHCLRERGEIIVTQVIKMRMWRRMKEGKSKNEESGKSSESGERSEQIWWNRFKFVTWEIQ